MIRRTISVIDTHTGGEPTRVVVAGGPDLGGGTVAQRAAVFREQFDTFRSAVVNEPRGSDVMVGALIIDDVEPPAKFGVIFFNNVGLLGMCGHGTIGVMVAMGEAGRISPGRHRIETPVGLIEATLEDPHTVSLENVPSYRSRADVTLDVPGVGTVVGDVAWGGNWFFLVKNLHETIALERVERLTDLAWRIRQTLDENGIRGDDGHEIDHVELYGPPGSSTADSKNFVLCPGKAYDRSPCGTGTSAKVACLAADGKLAEGAIWRQESVIGSLFEASYRRIDGKIVPTIRGTAYVNSLSTLVLDPEDPFVMGIRS